MFKKRKGVYSCLLLLVAMWCFGGCSGEELLDQVPQTMQVREQNTLAETDTVEETAEESEAVEVQAEEQQENIEEQQSGFLSEQVFGYAYNGLSEAMQIWYRDIEQALGDMAETVRLSDEGLQAGLDDSCIDVIFQCVLIDHPEIFYVDGYTYTRYSRDDDIVGIDFSGNYHLSMEEALSRKAEIEQAVKPILRGIDREATDYEKIKYVFETVVKNTEYNLSAPDNQNIYSVFVGHSSVCQGYAKATQYLLNALGVDCTLVQGSVYDGEGHAWNLVRADGSYYYVDATWGDASYQPEEGSSVSTRFLPDINYDYLCVTTEQLLRTHMLESYVPMPECVDTAANYYVREGALFTNYDTEQLKFLFEKAAERGQKDVTVKCADADCYQELKRALIEEQEIFNYITGSRGTVSYAHNEKQLSLTFWVTNE